ncbi:MAG: YggS family pyridoxal phosphate-dependent enzyme [Longimicrobiales bacterium]
MNRGGTPGIISLLMNQDRVRRALAQVRERVDAALERAGRSEPVAIVAVTKAHPAAAVEAVLGAGLRACGENRVAELEEKVTVVGRDRVEWHLIGHLQRNKARRALALFDLMHSVDSVRLAHELSKEAERAAREVRVLIQVNTSGEQSKSGFGDDAVDAAGEIAALPRLQVLGLMTMAPLTEDDALLRRTFGGARRLFEECARQVGGFEARHLSMGMSNDYEIAVEEGSTMLRLGTVLLGERTS